MTKKQCLEMTAALWDWLAENPDKGKPDWPGWAKTRRSKKFLETYCHCPCCMFTKFHCAECPVPWPRPASRYTPCLGINGPYIEWSYAGRQKRVIAAREVAALARSQL
jgi:hypothetical protein